MMQTALLRCQLIVKPSPIHGYGVFAGEDIKKGEIIEECYATILDDDDHHGLTDFIFNANGRSAVVFGLGSIYNHQPKAYNANYTFDAERSAMIYYAVQDIRQDDEIFIFYDENWFASRNEIPKTAFWYIQSRRMQRITRKLFRAVLVTGFIIAMIQLVKTFALIHG